MLGVPFLHVLVSVVQPVFVRLVRVRLVHVQPVRVRLVRSSVAGPLPTTGNSAQERLTRR